MPCRMCVIADATSSSHVISDIRACKHGRVSQDNSLIAVH